MYEAGARARKEKEWSGPYLQNDGDGGRARGLHSAGVSEDASVRTGRRWRCVLQ